ncbi:hypothetical protein LTR24_008394 [Lithohypha guttulata]|uniref:Wax synthase domain-containing protein n=1 Tax=Lithohypha guttulata TaxID=1690604 RepID=A0ABR0K033_9EURO|nr:hypothetical protein LTR24_008394 [Lithohypha guttulata]
MDTEGSLYRRVLQDRQDLYNRALADGVYTPFICPWDLLPVVLLILGVTVTPRLPAAYGTPARYALTGSSFYYLVIRWPYVRTVGLTAGYGIGLSGFWGMIMTAILLILHDPGKDFRRIEIRKTKKERRASAASADGTGAFMQSGLVRKRAMPDLREASKEDEQVTGAVHDLQAYQYVWQEQPREFFHLIDWSADLMTTFRGINWNIRVPLKTYVVSPPEGDPPRLSEEAQRLNVGAMSRLQKSSLRNFLYYYLLNDIMKTFMMTDPYLLGLTTIDSPTPWPWLARLNEVVPYSTKFVRLSVSLTAVVSALTLIFSLNPLFFGTILPYLLGDKLYAVSKSPLLEVWMYPPQWGDMFTILCNKGLAGMWNTWWHQMFRYGISEPAIFLTERLRIKPRSQVGRALQLFVGFGLTASIHAAASSTTFSIRPGKPWHAFFFFISQGVGIMVQTEAARWLNKMADFPKSGNTLWMTLRAVRYGSSNLCLSASLEDWGSAQLIAGYHGFSGQKAAGGSDGGMEVDGTTVALAYTRSSIRQSLLIRYFSV